MKRASLIFLSVFILFSLACGLLDDDEVTNITHTETIPLSFPINAGALCPSDVDCAGDTTPAPVTTPLDPIDLGTSIDVIELTGNKELGKFKGVFRSIEITQIKYSSLQNTLTFDLPAMTVYMGPQGATSSKDAGVVALTTIPAIAAGSNVNGAVPVTEAGRSKSNDLLQELKLSSIIFAEPVVEKGQPLPPSGSANIKLDIDVKFTVNPLDAI